MKRILFFLSFLIIFNFAGMYDVPEITHVEVVKDSYRRLKGIAKESLEKRKFAVKQAFNFFWYNQDITPTEFLDMASEFGDEQESFFIASLQEEAEIYQKDSSYQFLEVPCDVTPDDGTWDGVGDVTIGECTQEYNEFRSGGVE